MRLAKVVPRRASQLKSRVSARKLSKNPLMHSLYHALLAQHPRQLTPTRCASSTIAQLHRYFEDVVLENSLGALLIESLPTVKERSASEFHRVNDLVEAARSVFLFATADDALN